MSNYSKKAIVIDNGSYISRNGFAGDEIPGFVFPTVLAHPKKYSGLDIQEYHIGNKALEYRTEFPLNYPLEYGIVTDWQAMEKIWAHTFELMEVDPADYHILLTEAPMNPFPNREKMAEIMFETFLVPGMYVSSQAVLALRATGRETGLLVDCGHTVTSVVPIWEGFHLSHAISKMYVGGRDITDYLRRLIQQRGYNLTDTPTIEDIKEELCYVEIDPEETIKSQNILDSSYTLKDTKIHLGYEKFLAPEVYYQPSAIGSEDLPLHELVYQVILNSGMDVRYHLYRNIVVAGGSSMFEGLAERLHQGIEDLAPSNRSIEVVYPENRHFLTWQGGSKLVSDPSFDKKWVTREEYHDQGPKVIHRCM